MKIAAFRPLRVHRLIPREKILRLIYFSSKIGDYRPVSWHECQKNTSQTAESGKQNNMYDTMSVLSRDKIFSLFRHVQNMFPFKRPTRRVTGRFGELQAGLARYRPFWRDTGPLLNGQMVCPFRNVHF